MTDPTTPTQTRYPWRATLRTVLAAVVAFLPLLPALVDALGLSAYAWAAGIVTVAGAVTRLMALPQFDGWLRRYLPWLATTPAGLDQPRR